MALTGLTLIVLAWLYQLYSITRGNRSIRVAFVALYALGVLALVVDGFAAGLSTLTYLNMASFAASAIVLLLIVKRTA